MTYEIFFDPKAKKALDKLREEKARIKTAIGELKQNPQKGKPLRHSEFWSLRVGDYRVIYELISNRIVILYVGHRKNVYDDFSLLL